MGSFFPFQDLNLTPEPTTAVVGPITGPTTSVLIPKIEPKTEPVDEWPIQQPPQYDAPPGFFSNSQNTPPPPPQSTSTVTADTNTNTSTNTRDVYSEFNRVAELFRTAFGKRKFQEMDDGPGLDLNYGAIVPVPDDNRPVAINDDLCLSTFLVSPRPSLRTHRPQELVRVADLGIQDQTYFRDVVRRTRMIYDALRIYLMSEEFKRLGVGFRRRARGDLRASSLMREQGLWINQDKMIVGSIPGVNVGDLFFFRMELCVVGLHGQPQAGIDYLTSSRSSNGEPIATSIIVSGGYEDDEDVGDVLVYTGHGGRDKLHRQCQNQKLEGGNLAMERNMHYGIEVRVIRGFRYENSISTKVYVYDGLYRIIDCWFDVGKSGFGVYKFKLLRIEGQPEMGSSVMRFAQTLRTKPLTVRPTGYLSFDISNSREKVPVFLYNDVDNDHEPLYYEYLVTSVFPPFAVIQGNNGSGCECVSDCNDDCLCMRKNGGGFAYDHSGNLLRGKTVIFECGLLCKCSQSCRNRVTQRGLRTRLEIFRSRETGWGLRSLDLIQAGAFICEYAGVALTREQAEILSMNGDTLVYPGRFTEKWKDWGDLSKLFPEHICPTNPSIPPLDFALDVSRMRNVACYISHSSSPNVVTQFVLYDHNNLMFPHIMLFAMENIPPLTELSLDYGVAAEWTGKLSICN